MLASQFNLDHRLTELRNAGAELRDAPVARRANRSSRTVAHTLRSLVGLTSTTRPVRISAR